MREMKVNHEHFKRNILYCQYVSQNECSFVSLRDVERAMIVFEFFYEKMDSVFAPLIDKKAQEDYDERCAVRENAEV